MITKEINKPMSLIARQSVSVAEWPDIESFAYSGKSLNISGQEGKPRGLAINPDEDVFLVTGDVGKDVNEYSLSTPGDVSSGSYITNFSVNPPITVVDGLSAQPSGERFYVTADNGDRIYQYTSAWDLSAAASDNASLYVGSEASAPTNTWWKTDGTKIYVVDENNFIYQYHLSSAWDLDSGLYSNKSLNVGAVETNPNGLAISPTGKRLWVIGNSNDTMFQFTLGTAWDIDTATYDNKSFSCAAQGTAIRCLTVNSDGTKFWIADNQNDRVYQYESS